MHEQSFTWADCGKVSPPTDEGETVTRQHGWRVGRSSVGGMVLLSPRCPECYARHRATLPPDTQRRR